MMAEQTALEERGRDLARRLGERRAALRREIVLAEQSASGRHEARVRSAVAVVDDLEFERIMLGFERP